MNGPTQRSPKPRSVLVGREPACAGRFISCRFVPRAVTVTVLLLFGFASTPAAASPALNAQQRQQPPLSCEDTPGFHKLDFWVGEWDVFSGEDYSQKVGTNRIEKILDGCAVMEHWTDSGGGEGKSLFFYTLATDTWKQVWVTPNATRPGGVKEKTLVEIPSSEESPDSDPRASRFQGEITRPNGSTYLDRTTLTPMRGDGNEGKVRQVIEISTDGGENWRTTFDAVYVPKPKPVSESIPINPADYGG